jgi:hypothetical protein
VEVERDLRSPGRDLDASPRDVTIDFPASGHCASRDLAMGVLSHKLGVAVDGNAICI